MGEPCHGGSDEHGQHRHLLGAERGQHELQGRAVAQLSGNLRR